VEQMIIYTVQPLGAEVNMLKAEVAPLKGEKWKRDFRECAEGGRDLDGKVCYALSFFCRQGGAGLT
jgi:hypothetical protein